MAARPVLYVTLWITIYALAVAANFNLSSDISSFIPACATECFQSFLSANFDVDTCGSSPSLQCLCVHTGFTGFTIGEGALQCIFAENQRGTCQGVDGSAEAYRMCSSIQDAAPETHSTITATLLIPSGTGPIVVPSQTRSPTVMGSPPSSSSFTTPPPTSSSSVPSQTATGTPSGADGGQKLNTVQIIGISVGAFAAVTLAVGIIILAKCVRRRRYPDHEPGFFKMGPGDSTQASPYMLQISAPIHKTPVSMTFARPGDQRGTVMPADIGLALTPVGATTVMAESPRAAQPGPRPAPPGQQSSPPKLTLTIPVPSAAKPPGPAANGRESVVTEFAEDDLPESAMVWRPPPSDPTSATTYYVADKWGNWILGNQNRPSQAAELESPGPLTQTKAEKAQEAMAVKGLGLGQATMTTATAKSTAPDLARPRPANNTRVPEQQQPAPVSRSSSKYSNFSLPQSVVSGTNKPLPTLVLPPEAYQTLSSREPVEPSAGGKLKRKPSRTDRPSRRRSRDSATTIASSVAGGYEDDAIIEDEPQESLSPVVESPRTPISPGVSPVTYPKIPGSAERKANQSLVPPPLRTNNSNNNGGNSYRPPGQPSPTLGVVMPVRGSPAPQQAGSNTKLGRPPLLNPNPNRNPGQVRTGSPETRTVATPQEMPRLQGGGGGGGGAALPAAYLPPPAGRRRAETPPQAASQPPRQQPQQQYNTGQQSLTIAAPPHFPGLSANATPASPDSFNSGSSSLLAKRVGAEKAAALALGNSGEASKGRPGGAGKWRREGGGDAGSSQAGQAGFVADGMGFVPLPMTPGWQPKLTPTRRGDDLFLNVQ